MPLLIPTPSCPENTSAWVCTLFMLIPWLFFLSNPWPSFCSQLNPFLHQFYLLPFFSLTSLLHPVSCPSWALPHLSLHTCPMRALASPHSPQFAIQFPPHLDFQLPARHHPWAPQISNNCFSPVPPSKNGVSDLLCSVSGHVLITCFVLTLG